MKHEPRQEKHSSIDAHKRESEFINPRLSAFIRGRFLLRVFLRVPSWANLQRYLRPASARTTESAPGMWKGGFSPGLRWITWVPAPSTISFDTSPRSTTVFTAG